MQLGWDARYVRWSTQRVGWVPSEEAVLVALLEQGKPGVLQALAAGGTDTSALQEAALKIAAGCRWNDADAQERGERVGAIFGPAAGQAAEQFHQQRTGVVFVESRDFLHAEHLLAALLADSAHPAARLVSVHGGSAGKIVRALRKAVETYELKTDLTWRDRLVREAWYRGHACRPFADGRTTPPWERYPVDHWHFRPLLAELRDARAYPVLAELYSAIAAGGRLQDRVNPRGERSRQTFPAQDLVMAAHFHRLSGDLEEAAWCARRAMADVTRLVRQIEGFGRACHEVAYMRELAADAVVCLDRQLAITLYQEARALFAGIDEGVQQGEGAEDFGWGGFHREQGIAFLPDDPLIHWSAETRIILKLQHWLGLPAPRQNRRGRP